jgi:hypothetical protein
VIVDQQKNEGEVTLFGQTDLQSIKKIESEEAMESTQAVISSLISDPSVQHRERVSKLIKMITQK